MLKFQASKQLRICGHDDRGSAHREGTHRHRKIKSPANEQTCRDRDGDYVIRGRPNEILDHLPVGCARQLDCSNHIARIVTRENDTSGLYRHIGSRAHCNPDISRCQRRRVIHSVPDHRDVFSTRLKAFYGRGFVCGKNFGRDLIYSDALGDRTGNRVRISGNHRDPDTEAMKFTYGFKRLGSDLVFSSKCTEHSLSRDDIQNCFSVCCPADRCFLNFWRNHCFVLSHEPRSADHDALAIDHRLRTAAWQRMEVYGLQPDHAPLISFRDNGLRERVFGIGFDSGGKR
jgi:hypothetical protein